MVKETDDENVMKMWHYLNFVDLKFNMFDEYPDCDAFLNVKVVSVHSNYRNSGVLLNLGMKNTKANYLYGVCSSLFSARAGIRLGWKEVFTLPYSDYVDENGKQILFPDKPHDAMRVFMKYQKSEEFIGNYESYNNLFTSFNLMPQNISLLQLNE
jgi:arylalkylamine N-acetyltransferase